MQHRKRTQKDTTEGKTHSMKKRCSKCGIEKPATSEYFGVNSRAKDKLQYWCKKCKNTYSGRYNKTDAGIRTKRKSRLKRTKEAEKKWGLKCKYGITLEQHEQMYAKQNGCCAICGILVKYSEIQTDHNHETGKIRGLLCRCCNTGIGFLKDDTRIMENAISYLKS